MAAYRRVYDARHLQADCQELGSAPEPYARQSSMGYLYLFNAVQVRDSGEADAVLDEGGCDSLSQRDQLVCRLQPAPFSDQH